MSLGPGGGRTARGLGGWGSKAGGSPPGRKPPERSAKRKGRRWLAPKEGWKKWAGITRPPSKGFSCSSTVASGQPFALELLRGMLWLFDDVDVDLPLLLKAGVPAGVRRTIPPSGVWRPVEVPERPPVELLTWQQPWGSALKDPATLMRLVQEDVDLGFARWLPGGLEEARALFGSECAAGKLGLVQKQGSDPRLIGDSTVSGANLLCRIGERIELPSLQDVAEFLSRHPDEEWVGFIMDVSKAHKRVKVAEEDQGYSLFAVIDKRGQRHWLCYATCHFGCSWAAYWWSRAAACFVRIGHRLIRRRHMTYWACCVEGLQSVTHVCLFV